ncbi:hypothetical protein [Maridesulfovibrio sp.]|uniref:hypothetical protein n=1 Tax=Maridesulfovibrio sp. TaxID=2795000 RepID=UPI002AA84C4A|nr:hypothetical protein [Maridesulfovibrio sp.]
MDSFKLVHPKGMYWGLPNVEALPEIDFDKVAEETNLNFTDEICYTIKLALAEYISQVRSFGNTPPSAKCTKALKDFDKACKLIEYALEWDEPGTLSEEEYDPLKLFLYECVTPNVSCHIDNEGFGLPKLNLERRIPCDSEYGDVRFSGNNVADYLALCRERVEEELKLPSKSGRRENFAIRRCLKWLHKCYKKAGGEGRGVKRDGNFEGPFLTFAKMLLDYTKVPLGLTDDPYAESTLGTLVINKYQLK